MKISINLDVFLEYQNIALIMVVKITFVLQNTLIIINQPQFQTDQTKTQNNENNKNCNTLGTKTIKNDLLTLN